MCKNQASFSQPSLTTIFQGSHTTAAFSVSESEVTYMINWKVRFKNKTFWLALIPAAFVLLQAVLALFGITFDSTVPEEKLLAIVHAVFVLLTLLGVVTDPTTEGISDSRQALSYQDPKKDSTKY